MSADSLAPSYGYGGKYMANPVAKVEQAKKERPPPMITHFLPGLILGWLLSRLHAQKTRTSEDDSEEASETRGGKRKGGRPLPRRADLPKGVVQRSAPSNSAPAVFANDGQEMKMVLVVRQDLKMGGGKIAAQCSHAAVGTYHDLQQRNRSLLSRWEACGQPKIVVLCKDMREMSQLEGKASRAGLPTHVIADAGRTQVAAGSKTVLAVGPGPKSVVDSVTGHLKLLS